MPLERELPHRLRRSSLLGRSLLQDDLLYIAALIGLWLLHCYKTPPTLVGGHSVHPLNAKCKVQTPRPYVILSEGNARDEVLEVQQIGTDKTKRFSAQGSTKESL